jgi:transposase
VVVSFDSRIEPMRAISSFEKIYIHRQYVDFRKSINGLSAIVVSDMGLNFRKSAIFIFCNKKRSHMKMLHYDKSGFAIWMKRLEAAKFSWPKRIDKNVIEISCEDIELLLSGVNIWTRFESVYFEEIL